MVAAFGAGYAQRVQFHSDAQMQPCSNLPTVQISSPRNSPQIQHAAAPLAAALTPPQTLNQECTDDVTQEELDEQQALQMLDDDVKLTYSPTIACLSCAMKALVQAGYSRDDLESVQVDMIMMVPRWAIVDLLF